MIYERIIYTRVFYTNFNIIVKQKFCLFIRIPVYVLYKYIDKWISQYNILKMYAK